MGAEIDKLSPPELVKQFEDVLNAKPEVGNKINTEIRKIFVNAVKVRAGTLVNHLSL